MFSRIFICNLLDVCFVATCEKINMEYDHGIENFQRQPHISPKNFRRFADVQQFSQKRDSSTGKFCEIFQSNFFTNYLGVTASYFNINSHFTSISVIFEKKRIYFYLLLLKCEVTVIACFNYLFGLKCNRPYQTEGLFNLKLPPLQNDNFSKHVI